MASRCCKCAQHQKIKAMFLITAIAIFVSLSSFIYIFLNLSQQETDDDNIDTIYAYQIESFLNSDDKADINEMVKIPKSKQYKLGTHLKADTMHSIIKDGNSLQLFNQDLTKNDTQKYLYDSEELLSAKDDYPWGHIYKSRVFCSVLTMWPERRQNIEAVARTWAKLCDHIIFVVDDSKTKPPQKPPKNETEKQRKRREIKEKKQKKLNYEWEEAPDSHLGFDFLKLSMDLPQSEDWRNIWEKSWKTWYHVGKYHLNESEWFLKIDDDTFFSPINFKGFVRYYNPNKAWYIGNTLMHLWKSRNIVFNAGSCYALSRGALTKLLKVFESSSFLNPSPKRKERGDKCKCLCLNRAGAFEDPSMGICLHSIGIDPTNTLDKYNRERFSPFRENYHQKLKWKSSFWYFHLKPKNIGIQKECCTKYPISFHFYKHDQVKAFEELHIKYNVEEGVNGKKFEVPEYPRPFKHRGDLNFSVDKWRNSAQSKSRGQLIYCGPGKEMTEKCEDG